MNGIWGGEYSYADHYETVRFTAWLTDVDGEISGSTLEENSFAPDGPNELLADLTGTRNGNRLIFQKVYTADASVDQPPLLYDGSVNADMTEIKGTWQFLGPSAVTGRFRLSRISKGVSAFAGKAAKAPTQ